MHWAIIRIGKEEDEKWGHTTGQLFSTPGSEYEAKGGKESEIFGPVHDPSVTVVLLAEAHVTLRVAFGHANVVYLPQNACVINLTDDKVSNLDEWNKNLYSLEKIDE